MIKSALIIGGTGMLAKASRHIATRAKSVTLAARHPEQLADEIAVTPLIIDWNRRADSLEKLASIGNFDLVVSWLHSDGLWLVELLERKINADGRSMRIHGSAAGDPSVLAKRDCAPPSGITRQNVILGWESTASGRRWLTNDEISNAVIEAVNNPVQELFVAGTIEDLSQ